MCFFFQAEDGIRDLVRSRGLGDVYKRQVFGDELHRYSIADGIRDKNVLGFDPYKILTYRDRDLRLAVALEKARANNEACLLYTSDAADDLLCVDLGGRRIIKQKTISNPYLTNNYTKT